MITAFHNLGRTLEKHGCTEHALAARKDGDHWSELYEHAKSAIRDALNLKHRAVRHLRALAKGTPSND